MKQHNTTQMKEKSLMVRWHAESPSDLPPMDHLTQPKWNQAALSSRPGIELQKEVKKRFDEIEEEVGGVVVGRAGIEKEVVGRLISIATNRISYMGQGGQRKSSNLGFRWNASNATRCAEKALGILRSNPAYLHSAGWVPK